MRLAAVRPKHILLLLVTLVVGTVLIWALNSQTVLAQDEADTACQGIQAAGGDCAGGEDELNNVIQATINILLFIVGIASVIALIIGGLRYVVSGGDQQTVASAKNTIVYAIIGLIIAVLAFVAVRWVFDQIS